MNLKEFRQGIDILAKYYDKPDGHHIGAEHDVIYVYDTDHPVSPEDCAQLWALGWGQEGCDNEKGEYDPEVGWYAFV